MKVKNFLSDKEAESPKNTRIRKSWPLDSAFKLYFFVRNICFLKILLIGTYTVSYTGYKRFIWDISKMPMHIYINVLQ